MSAIEQLKSVSKQLQQLYEDCQLYASQHSHVTGTTNLSQRIKRDLHRANYALSVCCWALIVVQYGPYVKPWQRW